MKFLQNLFQTVTNNPINSKTAHEEKKPKAVKPRGGSGVGVTAVKDSMFVFLCLPLPRAADLALHPGCFLHGTKYLNQLLLPLVEALHHLLEDQQHLQHLKLGMTCVFLRILLFQHCGDYIEGIIVLIGKSLLWQYIGCGILRFPCLEGATFRLMRLTISGPGSTPGLDPSSLVQRLLTCRPLAFLTQVDSWLAKVQHTLQGTAHFTRYKTFYKVQHTLERWM